MTGKTVEDAVEQACTVLGLSRDSVGFEVIDMPQRRLFGSIPAKVRVYAAEEAFSVKELLQSEESKAASAPPELGKKGDSGKQKPEPRPEESEPVSMRLAAPGTPAKREEPAAFQPKTVRESGNLPKGREEPEEEATEIPESELPGSALAALQYLKEVAGKMQVPGLTYKTVKKGESIQFLVDGEGAALLIGRRGEVMDALQYLCLLVSNRSDGDYCKISIDVAGYREKREKTLQALAKRMADKVLKNRRSQTLEPMNPYERRIVHSTIQDMNGVKSESVGEEPNRRVVVLLEGDTIRPNQGHRDFPGNRGGRDGGRGGQSQNRRRDFGRDGRDSRPQSDYQRPRQEPKPPQDAKPQDPEMKKNLYGKIEF